LNYYNFESTLFSYIENVKNQILSKPLLLGGVASSGGGTGGPPGGYTGYLPQTRIAYDYTEAAVEGFVSSGVSILDNLNHIRYRLSQLESGSGVVVSGISGIDIYEDSVLVDTGVTVLNFTTGINAVSNGNRVDISCTASGIISGSSTFTKEFYTNGALSVASGIGYYVVRDSIRLDEVILYTNTVVSGATIIDINNNGVSIYDVPEERPTISGANLSIQEQEFYFTENDVISIDIDSTVANANNLLVELNFTSGVVSPGYTLQDDSGYDLTDENDEIISEDY